MQPSKDHRASVVPCVVRYMIQRLPFTLPGRRFRVGTRNRPGDTVESLVRDLRRLAVSAPDSCPTNHDFDPLSDAYLSDPYAVLAALPPATGPVFYAPSIDYYVVTRYAEIDEVFRD